MNNAHYRLDGRSEKDFLLDINQGEYLECKLCHSLKTLSDKLNISLSIDSYKMRNSPGSGIEHGNKINEFDVCFSVHKNKSHYATIIAEIKVNPCNIAEKWKKGNLAQQRTLLKKDTLSACIKRSCPIIWFRKDGDDVFWIKVLTIKQMENIISDDKLLKPYSFWTGNEKHGDKPTACIFHNLYNDEWFQLSKDKAEDFESFMTILCQEGLKQT